MNTWINTFLFFITCSNIILGQHRKLSPELNEISGLEIYKDSMFFAINDSGNEANIYCLDLNGKITKKVFVANAKNKDWEALAIDKEQQFLYIGDIGNNTNNRKKLTIYVVKIDDVLNSDTITPCKTIHFTYSNQTEFPPKDKKEWHFDAEAMTIYDNHLWVFTKSQTLPFDGISYIYKLNLKDTIQQLDLQSKIKFKSRSFRKDAITSAFTSDDSIYLLSYKNIFRLYSKSHTLFYLSMKHFWSIKQREALCILKNKYIVGNEKIKFLKAKLISYK